MTKYAFRCFLDASCNIRQCMCCSWHEDLMLDKHLLMGVFCDPGSSSLSSLSSTVFCNGCKIKRCDKAAWAQAAQDSFNATLVEWLVASAVELSYVRSGGSYLKRRVMNQPAQSQQHSNFCLSCSECSSSLPSCFILLCLPLQSLFTLSLCNLEEMEMNVKEMMATFLYDQVWVIHSSSVSEYAYG